MRAIIFAALVAVLAVGMAYSAENVWADPAPNPALETTPLFSVERIYPYVGVEQRWTFVHEYADQSDLLWTVGCAYSLGALAPSLSWRWNPQEGADTNELVLGLRLNLRSWPF
jgi:hypothetical protein